MDIITKLKNVILPRKAVAADTTSRRRNNVSLIIDELLFAFNESIESMSTNRNLMFHTAYVVYVPMRYYKDLHLSFGVISSEAAERFVEILQERMRRNKTLKYTPISETWSFDIIPLREDSSDTPDSENPDSRVTYEDLEEHFVAVRSTLVSAELYNFNAIDDDTTVRTNRSQPSSKYNRVQRLSVSAIRGLKPGGNGYSYPITLAQSPARQTPAATSPVAQRRPGTARASLTCQDNDLWFTDGSGNKFQSLDMEVDHFFVGGSTAADTYHGKPMVRLNAEDVLTPHFEIKLDSDNAFYIRTIGAITMCQLPVQAGHWLRLPDNKATITINGEYQLEFNKR